MFIYFKQYCNYIISSCGKLLLIAYILFAFSPLCFGKGGSGHYWDMVRVLPFDERYDIANKKIFDFYKMVNAYVDNANFPKQHKTGNPEFIKYDERLRNMVFANHRIWFHWGFNIKDPKRFRPLRQIVENNISEGRLKKEDESYFWHRLKREIDRRNDILKSNWAKISGYRGLAMLSSVQKEQSNGFVTLLVSIHLLGDHTTSETKVIIDRNTLYKEIDDAIDKIAGANNSTANREAARSLKNKLQRTKGDPNKYIDKLSKEFTPFLYSLKGKPYDYKSKFKELGYILK